MDISLSESLLIKHRTPNRCRILTGDLESDYWEKLHMIIRRNYRKMLENQIENSEKNLLKNINAGIF